MEEEKEDARNMCYVTLEQAAAAAAASMTSSSMRDVTTISAGYDVITSISAGYDVVTGVTHVACFL